MSAASFKLAIVANEHSGDALGASLVEALRRQLGGRQLQVRGMGGELLAAAGCELVYSSDEVRGWAGGFFSSVLMVKRLLAVRKALAADFCQWQPDVFVGVDASDFNLTLARQLRVAGIRTVQYVSPSVWCWRTSRKYKVAKSVHLLLALYSFEKQLYAGLPLKVTVVGHPMADIVKPVDMVEARTGLGLGEGALLGVMFGSRSRELDQLAVVFAQTAAYCHASLPQLQCITSTVSAEFANRIEDIWRQHAPQVPLRIEQGRTHKVMAACDALLVCNGTVALEATFLQKPMVSAYRLANSIAILFMLFSPVFILLLMGRRWLCLPNIIAGRSVVPEFMQWRARPKAISDAVLGLLRSSKASPQELSQLVASMPTNCSDKAAAAVLELVADD
ncbi:MAG: lipid-A-disaccharide synthase [Candidatus Porifericomitaceae bacterium WSBS_2022_MAG_OTU9]